MKTATLPVCGYSYSSPSSSSFKIVIVMGKSNSSRKSQSSPSPKDSDPTPPRSNVKQNLQILKLWKEFQKRKSSTPRPSTSYSMKKVEKEDIPEDTELCHDPTTTLLIYSSVQTRVWTMLFLCCLLTGIMSVAIGLVEETFYERKARCHLPEAN